MQSSSQDSISQTLNLVINFIEFHMQYAAKFTHVHCPNYMKSKAFILTVHFHYFYCKELVLNEQVLKNSNETLI